MNDFVIQGVTILGAEISNHVFDVFRFVLCALLSLSFFVFVCLSVYYKECPSVIFCSLLFILAIAATFLSYKEWKAPPETIYTISIDDTASYNEIKNNFYYIRELPNGLYEVKLKSMNS
jgi:hypothetical protein